MIEMRENAYEQLRKMMEAEKDRKKKEEQAEAHSPKMNTSSPATGTSGKDAYRDEQYDPWC